MSGPLVYVVAEFPKLSQTFVLGEIRELVRQGADVRVLTLRAGPVAGAGHVDASDLRGRVTAAPAGLRALPALASCAVRALAHHPRTAGAELRRVLRWTVRHHALHELLRFAQAAYLLPHVPPGTRQLHAHFAHGPASVAMSLAGLSGVPFSFTAHARDLFSHTAPAVLAEKVRAARLVVTVSEHGQAHTRSVCPDAASRVVLVRNGVDLAAFGRDTDAAARPFTLVTVCRLVEKKGVDVLVDALSVLRRRGRDVPAEIVGDGPLRAALQQRAERAGVADLLSWRGAQPVDEVAGSLARAACFVLPCRVDADGDVDGLPVSIVEAMAAGLPAVSTRVSGVPEVVVEGQSGLLVDPDDPVALADALQSLQDDRGLRSRLGRGALEVASRYDRRAWGAVLLGHLQPEPVSAARDGAARGARAG